MRIHSLDTIHGPEPSPPANRSTAASLLSTRVIEGMPDDTSGEDSNAVSRRQFLYTTGGMTTMLGLAACNSDVPDPDGSTDVPPDSETPTPEPTATDVPCTEAQAEPAETATKIRRTIYSQEMISNAQANINRFDWARDRRDAILDRTDAFLDAYSLDDIWHLVTGQRLPRASAVDAERTVGSPTHGEEIYSEHGRFPWIVNDRENTWTLTDPMSGLTYPTNDFASYLESGRDERGFFDPDLAEDRYLVNERYPDRGEKWGVDDGYGWVNDSGKRFTFVAYYNHFAIWSSRQTEWGLSSMVEDLGQAYLFTDDRKYARAAIVLLDRIADEYPNMTLEPYQAEDGFTNSHGGTGQGKILGSEWETRLVKRLLDAYDAVFPAIAGDERVLSLLAEKASEYDIGSKSTADDIRRNIENGIVRQVLPGVKNARIRGNFGTHQSALAKAAVVLDEPDGYTAETLSFAFQGGGLESDDCGYKIDGGNISPRLVGVIDRDGHNNEGAPNYHQLALGRIRDIADVLSGYDGYAGADLYGNVKVEQMHAGQPPILLLNRYTPSIGDSGRTGRPGVGWMDRPAMVDAFDRYGNPEYAQMAYLMNYNSVEGIHKSLFKSDPEQIRADIAEVIEAEGPLDLSSRTLAGFGFTALRDGSPADLDGGTDTQRAVWLYYGRNSGHGHQDTLNLGVAAHGLDLAPDFGYPAQTGPWPKRVNWTANTISHNTVLVDERRQEYQWVGSPRHFDDRDRVSMVDVAAPQVYPQTDTYRRTTALVRVNETDSYAVDFFRVDGGDDHHFSFHGAEGPVVTAGLSTIDQGSGTYAGEDVPKPGKGENTAYNRNGDHTAWGGKQFNNGFNYLYDVSRDAAPPDRFSVDWNVQDTWDALDDESAGDVHLRLTMLGEFDEVALASGDPPNRRRNPDSLRYVLAHRSGADLRSTFTSVIEPYEDDRVIEEVSAVPVDGEGGEGRAVRVDLPSGRTDYVASTTDPSGTYTVGDAFRFSGAFAVYSEVDGEPEYAYLQDGEWLSAGGWRRLSGPARLTGTVVDFTRDLTHENELVVELDTATDLDLEGRWVYVETDGERNGAYRIEGVSGTGRLRRFHLGQQTLVRRLADPSDPDGGYVYNVDSGANVVIPLGETWRE